MDCGVPFCHTGKLISGDGLGLPDQQPDPGVERPGLPRPVARGARAAAQDQQFPGVHRPRVPGALRGLLRARASTPRRSRSRTSRTPSSTRAGTRAGSSPARRAIRTGKKVAVIGSGPAGLAAAAQLNRAGHIGHGVRARGPPGRPADVRHSEHEARQEGGRAAPDQADGGGGHQVHLQRQRRRQRRAADLAQGIRRHRHLHRRDPAARPADRGPQL